VLKQAGAAARGATIYVTLEPCSHFGKTPPCTTALMQASIKRVVIACRDPFPGVRGKGIRQLRRAGIEVKSGVLGAEARTLNAPYFTLQTRHRPFFTAKWAMTLDGKIATRTGDSRWVSGEAARKLVHRLRSQVDAVMVGIGTVLSDDPLLTARLAGRREPVRIIVDSRGRLPLSSRLVRSTDVSPVMVATTDKASGRRVKALERAGCQVLVLKAKEGRVDLLQLAGILGDRQITNVLIEGGSRLLGSALDLDLIDKVIVFVAAKLVGGKQAPSAIAGKGLAKMREATSLYQLTRRRVGEDMVITGFLHDPTRL
jgi:diaminohydroxyphosphoribosylaminopyrimidine deaminase/5-amino-6-(5-phosphoribosylamino)uracil reductase